MINDYKAARKALGTGSTSPSTICIRSMGTQALPILRKSVVHWKVVDDDRAVIPNHSIVGWAKVRATYSRTAFTGLKLDPAAFPDGCNLFRDPLINGLKKSRCSRRNMTSYPHQFEFDSVFMANVGAVTTSLIKGPTCTFSNLVKRAQYDITVHTKVEMARNGYAIRHQ